MAKKKTESQDITTFAQASPRTRNLNKRIYTVPELVRLTERSRRQLIYWEKICLLKPKFRDQKATGSQPRTYYSAKEAVKALIVSDMLDRGLSLQQVQKVAQNLEKHGIQLDDSETYLLTDGNTVLYAENHDKVIDILKHEGQMLLVPIHEQVEKLMSVA